MRKVLNAQNCAYTLSQGDFLSWVFHFVISSPFPAHRRAAAKSSSQLQTSWGLQQVRAQVHCSTAFQK